MLVVLMHYLSQFYHGFAVFHYLTFRSILSALTALLIALICSPALIRWLNHMQIGQSVRDDGPKSHLKKSGTPTMGGVLIVFAIFVSMLLWGDWTNAYVWVGMFVLLFNALLGWWDDYLKVVRRNSKGVSAKMKLFGQSIVALLAVGFLYWHATLPAQTTLFIPFFKHMAPDLGAWIILLGYFVIVGSSNAVNLTDGLGWFGCAANRFSCWCTGNICLFIR